MGQNVIKKGGDVPVSLLLNIMTNAFRIATEMALTIFDMVDAVVDEYEDETGVDTAASQNENYDAGNDCYNPSIPSAIEQLLDSTLGWIGNVGGVKYRACQSFTLGATRVIDKISIYFDTKINVPTGQVTIVIETDNAGEPSGVLAHANATKAITPTDGAWNDIDFTNFSLDAGIYWIRVYCDDQANNNYWRWQRQGTNVYADGNAGDYINDVWNASLTEDAKFKVIFGANSMTLISEATTAEAQPDNARIVIYEEDVDAVTLNTDLKAYASRDNGTTWTQMILEDFGYYGSSIRILSGEADIAGQPAGTDMKYKLTTHNGKNMKIQGVALTWD